MSQVTTHKPSGTNKGRGLQMNQVTSRVVYVVWSRKSITVLLFLGWLFLGGVFILYCSTHGRSDSATVSSLPHGDLNEHLPILGKSSENGIQETVNRVLVVTYVRSGSSFLGDLLSANPSTFYDYEPLHMYTLSLRLYGEGFEKASSTVTNLFRCNFETETEYLKHSRKMPFFKHNGHLWDMCRGVADVCHHPSFVSTICRESKLHLMKLTFMSIRQVHRWMNLNEDISRTMRVVHLVRDPRAVLVSRRARPWCVQAFQCTNVEALCQQLREDLNNFAALEQDFPGKVVRVRHEDIASNPFIQARDLYARLGLNFSVHVKNFIRTHTGGAKEDELVNPYSTKRESAKTIAGWTSKLNISEVLMVQRFCSDVMSRLGYKLAQSEGQLKNGLMNQWVDLANDV